MLNMTVPRRMETFMIDEKKIWAIYSEKLYKWINEKYASYLKKEVSEDKYYEYLQFYETEIQLLAVVMNGDKILLQLPEVKDLQQQLLATNTEDDLYSLIDERFKELLGAEEDLASRKKVFTEATNNKMKSSTSNNISPPHSQKAFTLPSETKKQIEKAIKMMNHSLQLRVAIVGSESVGKTAIRFAIEGKKQPIRHHKGGGASISVAKLPLDKENHVKVSLIELEASKAQQITRMGFYKSSDVILIILDATEEEELFKLQEWLNEISQIHVKTPIIIVINKIDVKKTKIKTKIVENFIKKYKKNNPSFKNKVHIFEVSANKKKGIEELREQLLSYVPHF